MKKGYPSIDKPWLKYYDRKAAHLQPPTNTINDFLYSCIDGYDDYTTMTYFGRKTSYSQLKQRIETTKTALHSIGIRQGHRVLLLLPNIPETAYFFYALAGLGAVADFIDPRSDSPDPSMNAKRFASLVEEEGPRYIVALEQCYEATVKPAENELIDFGVQAVIIVSAADSMSPLTRLAYKVKSARSQKANPMLNDMNIPIYHWKQLSSKVTEEASYCPDISHEDIVAIVHTSGTSGKPKPIPLTHRNLNSYVLQTMYANMNIAPGDKVLHLLPYFAAFGLVGVAHAGFCHANNLLEIPEFTPNSIPRMLARYKPQIVIGVPAWFTTLPRDRRLANTNLAFLKMITYGGDSMSAKDESEINEFLSARGCLYSLTKGHGLSEACGCASYATNEYNQLGSCGIPLPMTNYAIVDSETKKPIPFDNGRVEGEIAISSPSITPGFVDGVSVADFREINGERYLLTGDLACMDEDGTISFIQRNDRTFARFDGFKVRPSAIERAAESFNGIEKCVVLPYSMENSVGNAIAASLLAPDIPTVKTDLKIEYLNGLLGHLASMGLSSRELPTRFYFLEEIPMTKSGKLNYKAIEESNRWNDYALVRIEETNLIISGFTISWVTNTKPKITSKDGTNNQRSER